MKRTGKSARSKCCIETCLSLRETEARLTCYAHWRGLPKEVQGRILNGWHGLHGEQLAGYVNDVVRVVSTGKFARAGAR